MHWDGVYSGRAEHELTWFETRPGQSLDLIGAYGDPGQAVIDVGAGMSRLADHLLAAGFTDVTVLELSQAALDGPRRRLGADAGRVYWVAGALPYGGRSGIMACGMIGQFFIS